MQLPPGLRARQVIGDPWPHALRDPAAEDPGTVLWDGSWGRCRAAFLFAPDRPTDEAVLLDLGLLVLFDTAAGLAPPQMPIRIERPDRMRVNSGRVAEVRATTAPDWAVLGFDVALDLQAAEPGETPGETCLAEEGFDRVGAEVFLSMASRHLLRWLEIWLEDGPEALASRVTQRTAPAGVMM